MLTYFHKNKLRYEKGQLAPFFILILVVLLVMAMVTVNLSKVAFIKTDSSNAADSGALAAGSVMANVFNAVASSNSQMETYYWDFYVLASLKFTMALAMLTRALIKAKAATGLYSEAIGLLDAACACVAPCTSCCHSHCQSGCPCCATWKAKCAAAEASLAKGIAANTAAIGSMGTFIKTTMGIMASVTAVQIVQYYFYLSIRDMADSEDVDDEGEVKGGRQQAIKLGHNFVFINSGIGSKLKEGPPLEELTEQEQKNNYRNEFSRFLDQDIGHNPAYTYPWEDGTLKSDSEIQERREHFVYSKVAIDEVNTFDLQVTVLPLVAALGFLGGSLALGYDAKGTLGVAEMAAGSASAAACGTPCAASGLADSAVSAAGDAIAAMGPIFPSMTAAWLGLLPGPIFTSDRKKDVMTGDGEGPLIICWIDDIIHNRLVRVDTWQAHQGEDYGIWKTKYPVEWDPLVHPIPETNERIESYSVVNFTGLGDIHPPVLRHDPSITETDSIGSP